MASEEHHTASLAITRVACYGRSMWQLRTKALLICGALFVLYNDWLFEPIFNAHASARYSLISELSARTQPYHWVFQSLDILTGMLTIMLLPWLWQFLRKLKLSYAVILFVAVLSIGADNIVDALLPISCAPTVDAQCNLLATHSLLTQAHLIESTAIGMVTFAAPLMWWWSCRNTRQRFIARASLWFAGLQVFVGSGIVLSRVLDYNVTGAFQRVYELGIGLWIVGILYVAIAATTKERKRTLTLQPRTEPIPVPVLAISYDE